MTDVAKICGVSIADIAKINGIGSAGISKVCGMNLAAAEFSPPDIDGCTLWLDASQITNLNDGDAVETWYDLSGNNNHFTQNTESIRPIYKTNILNGLPALSMPHNENRWIGRSSSISHRMIFAVGYYLHATFTDYNGFVAGYENGNEPGLGGHSGAANWYTGHGGKWWKDGVETHLAITQAWHYFGYQFTNLRNNGVKIGRDRNYGRYWRGYVTEAILYDNIISDADRQLLEAYLAAKWGI